MFKSVAHIYMNIPKLLKKVQLIKKRIFRKRKLYKIEIYHQKKVLTFSKCQKRAKPKSLSDMTCDDL